MKATVYRTLKATETDWLALQEQLGKPGPDPHGHLFEFTYHEADDVAITRMVEDHHCIIKKEGNAYALRQICVRLDPELKEQVDKLAKEEKKSVNKYIIELIKRDLEERPAVENADKLLEEPFDIFADEER